MKKKAIDTILDFVNKYRAVTFGALRMNFPHISDETIFTDTTRLCKRGLISYEKKKREIDNTVYFSETFNREHTKSIFDNTETGYQTALTALGVAVVFSVAGQVRLYQFRGRGAERAAPLFGVLGKSNDGEEDRANA